MSAARVKLEGDRARYFAKLYADARSEALREAEELVRLLRGRASLRRIHFAAYDAHMAAAHLYGHSSALAMSKAKLARIKAGRRGPDSFAAMGWPDAGKAWNARRKRAA